MKKISIVLLSLCLLSAKLCHADESELREEIESLKKQMQEQAALLEKLEDQATRLNDKQQKIDEADSKDSAAKSDTNIGGYGEISYNNYPKDNSRNQADLKRFVIFLGHRFNDQLSFNSEVEWEHAVTSASDQGESEIEQAYLNYSFKNGINLKGGLFLMPFGFLNESHEPPVFYGVERNEVETRIIPSTWREGGIAINGVTERGFAWETGITTSFDVAKFDDASKPLSASHQELQLAKADDLAYFGVLNYRGIPGLTLGGAVFTGDAFHSNADYKSNPMNPDFSGINGRITLWDLHGRLQRNGWDLEALIAKGSIGDSDRIDTAIRSYNTANSADRPYVPSEFYGWLVQAAYSLWEKNDMTLIPFIRYEKYNTQSKMPSGFSADAANADQVATLGISFKPDPQVVLKADYQRYFDNTENNRFNLGLGYMF